MQELGYNYRIPDVLCALGISQLKMADVRLKRRREIAEKYDKAFSNHPKIGILRQSPEASHSEFHHAYHLYVIMVKERLQLYNYLKSINIFPQVHYIPVYTMPYYRRNGYQSVSCPNAEKYYEQCLSIPMYPSLQDDEQDFVIQSILNFSNTL
jgi:dTDP-4-amino-4,6-dideoxygalactose transaminase